MFLSLSISVVCVYRLYLLINYFIIFFTFRELTILLINDHIKFVFFAFWFLFLGFWGLGGAFLPDCLLLGFWELFRLALGFDLLPQSGFLAFFI